MNKKIIQFPNQENTKRMGTNKKSEDKKRKTDVIKLNIKKESKDSALPEEFLSELKKVEIVADQELDDVLEDDFDEEIDFLADIDLETDLTAKEKSIKIVEDDISEIDGVDAILEIIKKEEKVLQQFIERADFLHVKIGSLFQKLFRKNIYNREEAWNVYQYTNDLKLKKEIKAILKELRLYDAELDDLYQKIYKSRQKLEKYKNWLKYVNKSKD